MKRNTINQVIVGSFEKVSIPEFGILDTVAKIDTGAYSGAIHCSKISIVTIDGKKILEFTPSDNDSHTQVTEHFSVIQVRSSTGHQVNRCIVETEIIIDGNTYPIRIGLSDRSDLKFEVLIGRKFLRENNMLVDVRKNQDYDTDGEQ